MKGGGWGQTGPWSALTLSNEQNKSINLRAMSTKGGGALTLNCSVKKKKKSKCRQICDVAKPMSKILSLPVASSD